MVLFIPKGNPVIISFALLYNRWFSSRESMPFGEVTRFEWGALESKAKLELWNPITKILLIYGTETKPCTSRQECVRTIRQIQIDDMYARRMPDLNYK